MIQQSTYLSVHPSGHLSGSLRLPVNEQKTGLSENLTSYDNLQQNKKAGPSDYLTSYDDLQKQNISPQDNLPSHNCLQAQLSLRSIYPVTYLRPLSKQQKKTGQAHDWTTDVPNRWQSLTRPKENRINNARRAARPPFTRPLQDPSSYHIRVGAWTWTYTNPNSYHNQTGRNGRVDARAASAVESKSWFH